MRARRGLSVAAAGLAATLTLAAVPAHAGDPFFGTFTDNVSMTREQQQPELSAQAATGLGVIREHVFWDRIERSPGVYDFSRFDQLVQDAADRGMTILPIISHPPAFHSSRPTPSTPHEWPPSDPNTMGRFAQKMVERYGHNGTFWCTRRPLQAPVCRAGYRPITHWQIWNEPDYPGWWKGAPNYAEYVPLLATTSAYIKWADPKAKVVAAGLSPSGATNGYYDGMEALHAPLHYDVMAYHTYSPTVAGALAFVRGMRDKMNAYGRSYTPLWITEYGWATAGRGLHVTTSEPCQAALIYQMTRRLSELRTSLNLAGAIQFMWTDRPPLRDIWPYYAGLVRVDGTPKPSRGAYQAAVAGQPAPPGLTLQEACPPELQATS